MHIVIMGCGRVGAALATKLDDAGHSVAVIDRTVDAFRRLPPTFSGETHTGVGFDRDTLVKAGIERAHAFAAVSSGDNSNILAARVARETYSVDNVVARIYDPRRAKIYERVGIPTVATVEWSTGQMMRRLLPNDLHDEWRDASDTLMLAQATVHPGWIGTRISTIGQETNTRIAFITRYGDGLLPEPDTVLQESDQLHVVVRIEEHEQVKQILSRPPARGGR